MVKNIYVYIYIMSDISDDDITKIKNEFTLKHRTIEEQEEIRQQVIRWFNDTYKPKFKVDAIIDEDYSIKIINKSMQKLKV